MEYRCKVKGKKSKNYFSSNDTNISSPLLNHPTKAPRGLGTALYLNIFFTEGRASTTMVKTPSTVPKGMNMHSMAPMTMQNI